MFTGSWFTVEVPETAGIHGVRPSPNKPASTRADEREDRSDNEERSASSRRKEGYVGIRRDCRVDLTGSSQAAESIVHLEKSACLFLDITSDTQGQGLLTPGQQKQTILMRRTWNQALAYTRIKSDSFGSFWTATSSSAACAVASYPGIPIAISISPEPAHRGKASTCKYGFGQTVGNSRIFKQQKRGPAT